ncbi:sperm-associated antigen 17 isoform X3 [Centropristis striata]|uniref:sperm-associated antigen 17 isoform X3 n=1 Tax=Centropristis striata TaxID=184440 RepID=UPI0027E12166|nr:sperm-associated antigen 17 isoform X3 [Centropristis striata]
MPPKAAKRGSAKKPAASGAASVNKNWEAGLAKAQFEEESWQTCVSLVVGRSPEEDRLTHAMSLAVQKPLRKLFNLLTLDSTLAKIHELGNPKAKRPDDIPMFYEVTEHAKVLLDAGQEIPCDLMAKILKFQLLQIKANDQQRREAEQAEEKKAKAGPPSASKEKGGAKVSDKKGKSPPSPVLPSKEKTKLKRRDDVEPPKFLDDEPQDGPQHYILLLGFYQPHLIGALDAIGVHVANVIKLCSEDTQTSEGPQGQHACEGGSEQRPVLDGEAEDHGSIELAAQASKLDLFWSGLRPVLDSGPPHSKLHDVVQLSCTIPDLLPPFHIQEPEAELEIGSRIFECVANLMYDCLDWRRQHQHYLNSIKLISVPTAVLDTEPTEAVPTPLPITPRSKKKLVREESQQDQETEQPPHFTDVDMRYYSNLLDLVPPEACSVPLIMHCMLEQVCVHTVQSTVSREAEEPKPHSGPGLDYQLLSFMLQSFLPLVHTEEEKSHMLNYLLTTAQNEEDKKRLLENFGAEEMQKKSEHPLVIRHHNERALRLMDTSVVQGFDPAKVELSMLKLSPVWKLIHSVAQQMNSNSCWMAIKQQLQHYCTDDAVSWMEVERLIHQSVFESMPLTRLDQKGVLLNVPGPLGPMELTEQQASIIIPWDNPLSFAKQQLIKLQNKGPAFLTENPGNTEISGRVCSQLDLSDIQSLRLRSLFDWHYAEHHSASIFPQVLQLASEEYRCLDTFRGSHNNTLYIFCHNPMSPSRQCKEFWDVALHTDVKFRKYLEYVADNISDWTKAEELKREAVKLRNVSPLESQKDENATDSAEEEDTLEPVIRKGSLKAWKLEQEQLKDEEMAKNSKKENAPKGKQPLEEAKSTDSKKSKTLSSGKKSRAETAGSSAKTPTESITTTAPPVEDNKELHLTEEPFNGFTGYSMDGKLIHVSGQLQYLFPSDGGHIIVESISYVEGSSLMKVAVKKDGHQFYTHINQVVVDPATPASQPHDKETNGRKEDFKETVEMKRMKQGSLSAVLDNGIYLSYSVYGPTGEYRVNPEEMEQRAPETSTGVPIPLSSSTHRSKGTDLDSVASKTHSPASHTTPPETQSKVCKGQPALPSSPFNSLNLSVPNGLLLQFLREDTQGVSSEEQGMLVKQSFPLHGREVVGQLPDPSLSKELSRIVTSQGAVIRYMRDGSTEVLFADGSVSFSQDSGPVWVPDSEVEDENISQENEDIKKEQSSEKEADAQRGCWLTTTPSGARIHTVGTTHKHIPIEPILAFKATDPITHEVMLSREDLVVSVQNPDRSLSVEHADGTRITSLNQERPPSTPQHILLHTGEQPESVTLKSTSECACGCIECVCVTRCADSIYDNMHIQDKCDNGGEISGDSAGKACDNEGAGHARTELIEHVCHERESSVSRNGDESVFADDTVSENGKRSACDSDKRSVSTKERVVLVEKEGCATVVMYPERHMAHVFLGDGTVITGSNQGAYQVFPSSLGLLQIQSDGKCLYSSDPLVTPSPKGGTPTNQPGSYTMSHTGKVACDITDPDGNHFQVMEDGQLSVLNCSPAPSTLKHYEEDLEEEDREMARIHLKHREHCPRLFLVHEDGSGTELLSAQTAEELLYQAYSDPTIALLKEPLPDTQDEFGITILKPSHQSVWSQWLLGKQNPDITPPNLRNRSWQDFPRTEKKSPGPPLGTDMGRGLTLRESSGGSATQHQPVRSCPKVLELRELHQHRPFTTPLKNTVDTRLKEYIESLMEREQRSEEIKVKDPRTEEESVHASDLLNLVLSFAEEEDTTHTSDKRTSVEIASLYSQGVGAPIEQSDVSEDTATAASDSFTHGKESKWTERLAQYRQEMCEEQAYREALRKKNIVPFFHPENIVLYQDLLRHQTPDMRRLSMDLPPIPKSDNPDAFLKDAPQENTPRPLNPTPPQSTSHAGGSDQMPEKRPTNPTPKTAGDSSLRGSSGQCKSVQVDVTGKLRRTKVRLPTSILSSKPRSVPNQQFLSVEEPVRRKCRTISLTDPNVIARGFQLLPSSVDFGTLQEGTSSAITVMMKNVGVDTCRFHVKQPPPAKGLRVIYNPGPVAAGLHVELQVQLFAMCAVQPGEVELKKYICQDIIIHTETDILYLPVTATILPERLYNIWLMDHNKKGSRVRQLSSSLPVGRQAVQPHRGPGALLTGPSSDTGRLNHTNPL